MKKWYIFNSTISSTRIRILNRIIFEEKNQHPIYRIFGHGRCSLRLGMLFSFFESFFMLMLLSYVSTFIADAYFCYEPFTILPWIVIRKRIFPEFGHFLYVCTNFYVHDAVRKICLCSPSPGPIFKSEFRVLRVPPSFSKWVPSPAWVPS